MRGLFADAVFGSPTLPAVRQGPGGVNVASLSGPPTMPGLGGAFGASASTIDSRYTFIGRNLGKVPAQPKGRALSQGNFLEPGSRKLGLFEGLWQLDVTHRGKVGRYDVRLYDRDDGWVTGGVYRGTENVGTLYLKKNRTEAVGRFHWTPGTPAHLGVAITLDRSSYAPGQAPKAAWEQRQYGSQDKMNLLAIGHGSMTYLDGPNQSSGGAAEVEELRRRQQVRPPGSPPVGGGDGSRSRLIGSGEGSDKPRWGLWIGLGVVVLGGGFLLRRRRQGS